MSVAAGKTLYMVAVRILVTRPPLGFFGGHLQKFQEKNHQKVRLIKPDPRHYFLWLTERSDNLVEVLQKAQPLFDFVIEFLDDGPDVWVVIEEGAGAEEKWVRLYDWVVMADESRTAALPDGVMMTHEELIEDLADVSHGTWMRQTVRDKGTDPNTLSSETTDHDRERARDTIHRVMALYRGGRLPSNLENLFRK